MKHCPHCAEEVQDAARVCKHCGRDIVPVQPVVATVKTTAATKFVAAIIGGLVLLMIIGLLRGDPNASPDKPANTLKASAAWSPTALKITNTGSPEAAGKTVTIYLNGSPPFTYRADVPFPEVGQSTEIPLAQFTLKDGERFNPFRTAITVVWLGGNGYDYRSFKNR